MGNWDYKHHSVQQFDNPESSAQIASKGVLVSFGPPVHDPQAQTVVCGFVQNLNMNQQKRIQQLFEIGSERRYWVDGPDTNNLQINRALFSGPSILKVAGMGLAGEGIQAQIEDQFENGIFDGGSWNSVASGADKNFWISLGSDFFNNPLGIMIEMREIYGNGESSSYGSMYLSNAKIRSHGIRLNAQNWLIQENLQIQFERPIPLFSGSTHEDHYEKRQEIMDDTQNMTPEWFNEYTEWQGERSEPR